MALRTTRGRGLTVPASVAAAAVTLVLGACVDPGDVREGEAVQLARLCVSVNERATGEAVDGWVDGAAPTNHRFVQLALERQRIVVSSTDRFRSVCRIGS